MLTSHLMPTPSERVLSTLNADGSRRWLRPRLSPGRFLNARRIVGWSLIGLFAGLPFVSIGGAPAVLLDVTRRQFTLFGKTFLPTDTILLAILLLGIVVGAFLLTALLGRVWCGWACPQTVYLEFLYRPLERFFDGPPGRGGTIGRRATGLRTAMKYAVYGLCSVALANVFLSYFVGVHSLQQWMSRSPIEHPTSFAVMAMTTALMFTNFVWFREQTCIVACPYGRLQSVLLDANSLVVSYDPRRGEPRGHRKGGIQSSSGSAPGLGDCVDCGICVETCPTGIDIRRGLRMECIGCAQCIDACDAVMAKRKLPSGLIRYSSQARIAGEGGRFLRPRLIVYTSFLLLISGLFAFLVAHSKTTDVAVLRGMGMPFTELSSGEVANPLRIKITNRTREQHSYSIHLAESEPGRFLSESLSVTLEPAASMTRDVALAVPPNVFFRGKHMTRLAIIDDKQAVTEVAYELLGPQQATNPLRTEEKTHAVR